MDGERHRVVHGAVRASVLPSETDGRPVVAVILPALNEALALPHVLGAIPAECVTEVIVVDNGSTDDTAAVAYAAGARVVSEPERGYGAACLAGIDALDAGCDIVVFLDADASDDPNDLQAILAPILDGRADFVLGDRTATPAGRAALLPHQRSGNALATWLIHRLFGHAFRDLGPFRAIRRASLDALAMQERTFGWTVEMQVQAVRHRLRIVEVPVHYRARIGTSKVSGTIGGSVRAGVGILRVVFGVWARGWRN